MASYQDIDVRLVGVENALAFLMSSIQVKQLISSPLAPEPIVRQLSMLELWKEQCRGDAPIIDAEPLKDTNGTDSADVSNS